MVSMVRPEKAAEVELLVDKMKASHGLIFADFSGLSVSAVNELRGKCRENNVEFRVVKNRLARRAAAEADVLGLEPLLKGPTAIAFGMESAVEPAKVLIDFKEDHEQIQIKGGYLDGELLAAAQVEALSKVPTRIELLAMIARSFNAPAQNFVSVLSGTVRQLVGTLDAVAKQKDGDA